MFPIKIHTIRVQRPFTADRNQPQVHRLLDYMARQRLQGHLLEDRVLRLDIIEEHILLLVL